MHRIHESWCTIFPQSNLSITPWRVLAMQKHPHAHFTAGFHTYWFSLNSWCKCFYLFCRWFLKSVCSLHVDIQCQLTWSQLVRNCDQNSDADSVRTPLSSAWRQVCTYVTPATGLSGPSAETAKQWQMDDKPWLRVLQKGSSSLSHSHWQYSHFWASPFWRTHQMHSSL